MSVAIVVILVVAGLVAVVLVANRASSAPQWRRSGAVKTVVTPLANGWRREQVLYEFVDVAKEGHFKWEPVLEHDDISPTGIKVHIDRRDYSW